MAVGDLIVANYQYEYNGILFGSGTKLIVNSLDGIFDSTEVRSQDLDRYDQQGAVPGPHYRSVRKVTMTFSVNGDTGADAESILLSLNRTLRPKLTELQWVMQRPGRSKLFLWARPDKYAAPTSGDLAHGLLDGAGAVEWVATDPLWYSLTGSQQQVVIANGSATNNGVFVNNGTEGTLPVFTITGPCTNPRLTVSGQTAMDDGEVYNASTIALDLVMSAGDTLVIDVKKKIVTLNGVRHYEYVRADNTWWKLLPGNNTITYSRTGTGAASTLTVNWNDAWS